MASTFVPPMVLKRLCDVPVRFCVMFYKFYWRSLALHPNQQKAVDLDLRQVGLFASITSSPAPTNRTILAVFATAQPPKIGDLVVGVGVISRYNP